MGQEIELVINKQSELIKGAAMIDELGAVDNIGLVGDLGAGKTAFAKEFLRLKGVKGPINSPTFVIMNEYAAEDRPIEHWDLFRLKACPEELICSDRDRLALIEWADKFEEALSICDVIVKIDLMDNGFSRRLVIITRQEEQWEW